MSTLPEPLVAAEVDLQDFPFTPMFRAKLFGSSFHARVSDAGWRAGVTLWLKSWDQVPAGTLPDDEIDLCRLAELGRDLKTWRKLAKEALWGWFICADGRMHHKVVADGVNEAWAGKLKQRHATECARIRQHNKRHGAEVSTPSFDEWNAGRIVGVTDWISRDTGTASRVTTDECHADVPCETHSKRQGQGQRQGSITAADAREPDHVSQDRKTASTLLMQVGDRVLGAMGLTRDDGTWRGDYGPIQGWLAAGADVDIDILPTVRRLMGNRTSAGPPRSLAYFTEAVLETAVTRTRIPELPNARHAPSGAERRQQQPRNGFAVLADEILADRAHGADPLGDGGERFRHGNSPVAPPGGCVVIDGD